MNSKIQELYDDLDGCCMNTDDLRAVIIDAQKGKYGDLPVDIKDICETIESTISDIEDLQMEVANSIDEIDAFLKEQDKEGEEK